MITGGDNNTVCIHWLGIPYRGIRQFGFDDAGAFLVYLWTTPPPKPRGSYGTVIPISPLASRDATLSRCGFERADPELLFVYDDWGKAYRIEADAEFLDVLVAECKAQELPDKAPAPPPPKPKRKRPRRWRSTRGEGIRGRTEYQLFRGDYMLACVAEKAEGGRWYWYGSGWNSLHAADAALRTWVTADDAKAAVIKYLDANGLDAPAD